MRLFLTIVSMLYSCTLASLRVPSMYMYNLNMCIKFKYLRKTLEACRELTEKLKKKSSLEIYSSLLCFGEKRNEKVFSFSHLFAYICEVSLPIFYHLLSFI